MIELRPYQKLAVRALLATTRGIVKAPAGGGKTLIMAAAVHEWLGEDTGLGVVWYANTKEQVEQAEKACAEFNLRERCSLHICCYQSGEAARNYEVGIYDECHHIASREFRRILDGVTGIRWGCSATPERGDDLKDDVFDLLGPIVYEVDRTELVDSGKLAKARVIFHAPNEVNEMQDAIELSAEEGAEKMDYAVNHVAMKMATKSIEQVTRLLGKETRQHAMLLAEKYGVEVEAQVKTLSATIRDAKMAEQWMVDSVQPRSWLVSAARVELLSRARWHACQSQGIFENEKRNRAVAQYALGHLQVECSKDSVLILVGSIEHGKFLQTTIPGSLVLHSKMGAKARREGMESFRNGTLRCAIATSLADEGLDVPRASVLILAAAGRSAGKAEQRTGRVLRAWGDKTHGTIHDFWDHQHPLLMNQSRCRAKVYAGLDYEFVGETPEPLETVLRAIGITLHPATGMTLPKKRGKKNLSSSVPSIQDERPRGSELGVSRPQPTLCVAKGSSGAAQNISENNSCEVASTPVDSAPVIAAPPEQSNPKAAEPPEPVLPYAERKHARLSPSTLESKAKCPGFRNDPTRDKSAANRGTLGHAAVEKGKPNLCGEDVALRAGAVKCIAYKKAVFDRYFADGKKHVVQRYQEIKLKYYDQWGFCDELYVEWDRADLLDWKFAFNFYEANKPQFHAYCLGVWDKFPRVEKITVHVGHPFLDAVDVETFSRAEHYDLFYREIAAVMAKADRNDPADYQISKQCGYCGFATKCAKLANLGLELGRRYATDLKLPAGTLHGSEVTDPAVFAALLHLAPIVEAAASGWRRGAMEAYSNGTQIPGFKAIARSGKRSIASAAKAFNIVKEYFAPGLEIEKFLDACTVTATGLDEIVAASAVKGDKGKAKERLAAYLEDEDILQHASGSHFLKSVVEKDEEGE